MLTQYKNIEQILIASQSLSAERYTASDVSDFQTNVTFNTDIIQRDDTDRVELHVYLDQTWITANHNVPAVGSIPQYYDGNNIISFTTQPLAIDLYAQLQNQLKISAGQFRFVVNFFKNLIGNYDLQYLKIQEISPDRTEIALRPTDPTSSRYLQQITNFIQTINLTSLRTGPVYKTLLLNFSRNNTATIINAVEAKGVLYIKLYEPLSEDIQEGFKCWIVEEQKQPYVDNVVINPAVALPTTNVLSGPNWQANYSYNTSAETGFKTWTDLLGSSLSTSQQIIDAYFSGSLSGMKLNIDYSDFNNFVFYSTATDRLDNFKYKLELLEYYAQQSASLALTNGIAAQTDAASYQNQITSLIGGFDGFEQYLYNQSSSILTTFNIPLEQPIVARLTGSYITPVPKLNSTYPYINAPTTSSQFIAWYSSSYEYANIYDTFNINSLYRNIPSYQRIDDNNIDMITFVNMLGHHYDILYTYINHMSRINKREENPKLGMPNELLYSVAKQFGWNLTNGNQDKNLWQYVLGTSEAGAPLTGSNTVGDPSVPAMDITYTVWRRIINNLPLLLKSKGTKRSIQALLSCYGIPQSLISINEYGGPRLERAPIYEKLNFDYALDLSGSTAGTVTVNYSQSINAVELRFRTADVVKYPTIPSTMNLFTIGSNIVTLNFTSGNKGVVQINGTSSNQIELFDGNWLNLVLRTNGTNLDIVTKKSKYGSIVAAASASATASFAGSGTLTLGGTSTGANRLVGQLQELRLWSSSLNDEAFNNHVKAPAAYNGNIDSYTELVFRLPLTQNVNHNLTGSLTGVEPNPSTISASFSGWSLATPYDSIEETYYYDAISLGGSTFDDNKIRLENNELVGTLSPTSRAERSQFDKAPLDSKKIGVYFSPQTMIDEDIIAQLGFTNLDDYIGDPGNTNPYGYPDLIIEAQKYWKKYTDKNDFNSYISMFTLFDLSFFKQLEQLLPARVEKITGVLVQPNILERNKDTILPIIQKTNDTYNAQLASTLPTASAYYVQYTGSVDGKIMTLSGTDDDQLQGYLTASIAQKYNGTTYSYQYLTYSGSTYYTSSTPYWRSEVSFPAITSSVTSEYRFVSGTVSAITSSGPIAYYGTGSYGTGSYAITSPLVFTGSFAQVQDYLPRGIENHRYAGCKITGPGFNAPSTESVDGGPIVQWSLSNPNQLVYQQLGQEGNLVITNKKNPGKKSTGKSSNTN